MLFAPSAARAAAPPPDSVGVHFELGATTDVSNELYYEQSYTDTTFLGRQLHGTPESHAAGVAALDLAGASGAGRWGWALRPEATWGDVLQRAEATGALRFRPDPAWRLAFEPRAEIERDQSFGLDRREQLLGSSASARRRFADGSDAVLMRLDGEHLDTPGSNDPYLLAHRVGAASIGWEHDAVSGLGWELRAEQDLRAFPDSTERDHRERQFELNARRDFLGGHGISMLVGLTQREPMHVVPGSRDHFDEARGELRATVRTGEAWALVAGLEGDGYRYAEPDSLVDFDYTVVRGQLHLRHDLGTRAWLGAGPRWERLSAPWNTAERYDEGAFSLEAEFLGATGWWMFEPSAGRRGYQASENGQSLDPNAIHSSYLFADVQVLGDQGLPRRWRARLTLSARAEKHDDPSQDSRSLYFSLDLRRLF